MALARAVYDIMVDGVPMEGFSTRFQEYCCIDRAKSEEKKRVLSRWCGCTKRSQTVYEEIPITSKACIVFCWYFVDDDGMHEMENRGGRCGMMVYCLRKERNECLEDGRG